MNGDNPLDWVLVIILPLVIVIVIDLSVVIAIELLRRLILRQVTTIGRVININNNLNGTVTETISYKTRSGYYTINLIVNPYIDHKSKIGDMRRVRYKKKYPADAWVVLSGDSSNSGSIDD